MARKALLIGMDHYQHWRKLESCVANAEAMKKLLARNYDGSHNFDCRLMTSCAGRCTVTRRTLRAQMKDLFSNSEGDVLFYFSGHGACNELGGFLATEDGVPGDPGVAMNELLTLANQSKASSVLVILDCCFGGDMGNPPNLQGGLESQAQLREGLTILSASRSTQIAMDADGYGVFTRLVLGALSGGAADVRGRVSAASIYAYVEQALGSWEQRPLYKSHADHLPPVRWCQPTVPDSLLRRLPSIFKQPNGAFRMDPSFERTHPSAERKNVQHFEQFKVLRNAGLLKVGEDKDLFYAALESKIVRLTPLGQFYWHLANKGQI